MSGVSAALAVVLKEVDVVLVQTVETELSEIFMPKNDCFSKRFVPMSSQYWNPYRSECQGNIYRNKHLNDPIATFIKKLDLAYDDFLQSLNLAHVFLELICEIIEVFCAYLGSVNMLCDRDRRLTES